MDTKVVILKNGFTRNQSHTSSAITTARTKMTATELKIFYQATTLIDSVNDTNFNEYSIDIKNFCEAMNLNDTNREFIVKTCKSLLRQVFEIEEADGDYIGYTIFKKMHYKHKEQKINFAFNDEMKPYLLELKRNFTQIKQVKYIKEFESKYAIRIYALLKDYRLMGHRDINIEALSKMLQLPKSYSNYKFIRLRVLEPALKEINEKSDLEIYNIEPIEKQGKKIITIRIEFGNKADKIADDCVKMLRQKLKRNNDNLSDTFVGYAYSISETSINKGDIFTIAKIEKDERDYYSCKDINNNTLFACMGKKQFTEKLIFAIYLAMKYQIEQEKNIFAELPEWQNQQDKIKEFKDKFQKLIENYDKRGDYLRQ